MVIRQIEEDNAYVQHTREESKSNSNYVSNDEEHNDDTYFKT